MGITYQEEKFSACLEEMKPLFEVHWAEVANHKDDRPLDPDYPMYYVLNDHKILRIFTARDEGKLIGYSFWIVANHLHYRTWMYAVADIYWLDPAQRKTGVSFDFFNKTEEWLKSLGVKSVNIQDKVNHSHNSFFGKLGYTPTEQNYEKII